jgi:hypothetical protein
MNLFKIAAITIGAIVGVGLTMILAATILPILILYVQIGILEIIL